MTFYMVHEGKLFCVSTDVGCDPEKGKNENRLSRVHIEELQHSPLREIRLEPSDEEYEP